MVHRIYIWLVYVSTCLLTFIIFMQVKTCRSHGSYGTVTSNCYFKRTKWVISLLMFHQKLHLGLSSSELVKGCLDLLEIMQLLRK